MVNKAVYVGHFWQVVFKFTSIPALPRCLCNKINISLQSKGKPAGRNLSKLSVLSQNVLGTSKNPTGLYKAYMHVHVSKLSISPLSSPQMYDGTSKNPTGFYKAHKHVHVSKLSIPSQMYYGTSKNPTELCKLHSMYHVSKMSVPSQMYYGILKNPTELCKVHMQC